MKDVSRLEIEDKVVALFNKDDKLIVEKWLNDHEAARLFANYLMEEWK